MNILPKKNWHVRSKTNIARVRADEAKAAEEERKEEERIKIAEQEYRTNLLRNQARSKVHGSSGGSQEIANFLMAGEDGKNQNATNKDYEIEKKEEKEREEKAIGLLTYLGQSALDPQQSKPWWSEAPKRASSKRHLDQESEKLFNEWETKKKLRLDPMAQISRVTNFIQERDIKANAETRRPISHKQQKLLESTPFHLPEDITRPKSNLKQTIATSNASSESKQKRKKSKKEKKSKKKKKHKKEKKDDTLAVQSVSESSRKLEALRNERLQRERAERSRELALMQKHHLEKSGISLEFEEEVVDERALPYNSAFNPHLSRRPFKKRKTNEEIVSELCGRGKTLK